MAFFQNLFGTVKSAYNALPKPSEQQFSNISDALANRMGGQRINQPTSPLGGATPFVQPQQQPVSPFIGPSRPINPMQSLESKVASNKAPMAPVNDLMIAGGAPTAPVAPVAPTTQDSGYTSTDPAVQAQIQAMQQQVVNRSSQAPVSPNVTSDGQNVNPETGGISQTSTPTQPDMSGMGGLPTTEQLAADVARLSQMSPEEIQAYKNLNALRAGVNEQIYGEGQRPIAKGFITGRQRAIAELGAMDETNILNQAALAQAQRQGELTAAQSLLTARTPQAVAEGTTLIDPITGATIRQGVSSGDTQAQTTFYNLAQAYPDAAVQYDPTKSAQENLLAMQQAVASAPSFAGTGEYAAPTVEKFGENDYRQWNSTTGEWEQIAGATSEETAQNLIQKQAQFDLMNTTLQDAFALADVSGRSKWFEGVAQGIFGATKFTELQTLADTIKTNLLTLAGDPDVKKFFGPQMSEADVRMMQAGGTTLDPERQTPEAFKAELQRVTDLMNRLQGSVSSGVGSGGYNFDSQEGIDSFLDSFSFDLSTSVNGSTVSNIANAIGQFESGGNYSARGPVVTSGMYKGERAAGKYQIMPGNIPSWSREALGREVSLSEFMANPDIQDKIAQYKMNEIFNQYGTVEDVASVWFSGQPVSRAGNVRDDNQTTVPQYIRNIVSIYNNLG